MVAITYWDEDKNCITTSNFTHEELDKMNGKLTPEEIKAIKKKAAVKEKDVKNGKEIKK